LQHGGDQQWMFDLSRSLVDGLPIQSVVGIGQALVMAPFIAVANADSFPVIVKALTIVNGLILGPLSVLVVGGLALYLTRRRWIVVVSAAVWAVLPLIAYVAFFWHPEELIVRSAMVPKVGWLTGLSDPPAAFCLLVATLLLAVATRPDAPLFWLLVGAGMSLGLALDFRAHTLFMIVFLIGYVGWVEGWRGLLAFGGGGLLTYLLQAWYNQAVFGLPFTIGYISYGDVANYGGTFRRSLNDMLSNLWFSPRYFAETFNYFVARRLWLLLPLTIGIALFVIAIRYLKQYYGWKTLALLIFSPLAYLLPLLATFNFRDDPVRMLMPILPLLLITGLIGLQQIGQILRQHRPSPGN